MCTHSVILLLSNVISVIHQKVGKLSFLKSYTLFFLVICFSVIVVAQKSEVERSRFDLSEALLSIEAELFQADLEEMDEDERFSFIYPFRTDISASPLLNEMAATLNIAAFTGSARKIEAYSYLILFDLDESKNFDETAKYRKFAIPGASVSNPIYFSETLIRVKTKKEDVGFITEEDYVFIDTLHGEKHRLTDYLPWPYVRKVLALGHSYYLIEVEEKEDFDQGREKLWNDPENLRYKIVKYMPLKKEIVDRTVEVVKDLPADVAKSIFAGVKSSPDDNLLLQGPDRAQVKATVNENGIKKAVVLELFDNQMKWHDVHPEFDLKKDSIVYSTDKMLPPLSDEISFHSKNSRYFQLSSGLVEETGGSENGFWLHQWGSSLPLLLNSGQYKSVDIKNGGMLGVVFDYETSFIEVEKTIWDSETLLAGQGLSHVIMMDCEGLLSNDSKSSVYRYLKK